MHIAVLAIGKLVVNIAIKVYPYIAHFIFYPFFLCYILLT